MGVGKDRVDVGLRPRPGDERHALVTVEAGQRGQRAALDLDNGDAQGRGVDRERVEGRAPLRDDQQADRLAPRGEGLLDRAAAADQLLDLAEQLARVRGLRCPCAASVELGQARRILARGLSKRRSGRGLSAGP